MFEWKLNETMFAVTVGADEFGVTRGDSTFPNGL